LKWGQSVLLPTDKERAKRIQRRKKMEYLIPCPQQWGQYESCPVAEGLAELKEVFIDLLGRKVACALVPNERAEEADLTEIVNDLREVMGGAVPVRFDEQGRPEVFLRGKRGCLLIPLDEQGVPIGTLVWESELRIIV